MFKLLATLMLVAPFVLVPAGATQTCEPISNSVCTGNTASTDNGQSEFGGCNGNWVDVWGQGYAYAQICIEHGSNTPHVWACPLAEWVNSPNCKHVTV